MYCGADIGDLTDVLRHVNTMLPHSPLLAVGASMGRYEDNTHAHATTMHDDVF